jgi:hypothetical protein
MGFGQPLGEQFFRNWGIAESTTALVQQDLGKMQSEQQESVFTGPSDGETVTMSFWRWGWL